MAPGDVCHGPRCSLAGLGPVALEYRSCHWPGGSAGSPQCVRPMGYWFFPVPRLPYVCAASWAVGLLFTGVPTRCVVLHVRCPGPLGSCLPVRVLCAVRVCLGWMCPSSSPPNVRFFFLFFFFLKKEKEKTKKRKTEARVHCRHRHGQLVRRCYSVVSSGVCRRCCGGGRAPGVRLACPDVHGYGSGWVWLGVSLLLVLAG